MKHFTLKFHFLKSRIEEVAKDSPKKNLILQKVDKELEVLKAECAKRSLYLEEVRIGQPLGTNYLHLSNDELSDSTRKTYKLFGWFLRNDLLLQLELLADKPSRKSIDDKIVKFVASELQALRQEMRIRCLELKDIPDSNLPAGRCEYASTQTVDELVKSILELRELTILLSTNPSKTRLSKEKLATLKRATEELHKAKQESAQRQVQTRNTKML